MSQRVLLWTKYHKGSGALYKSQITKCALALALLCSLTCDDVPAEGDLQVRQCSLHLFACKLFEKLLQTPSQSLL